MTAVYSKHKKWSRNVEKKEELQLRKMGKAVEKN